MSLKIGASWRRQGRKSEEGGEEGFFDHAVYRMNPVEWGQAAAIAVGLPAVGAYVCYRSWAAFAILLIPSLMVIPRAVKDGFRKKRLRQLEIQFKDAIQAISASLSAGLSVENAVAAAERELELMYGAKGIMCRELRHMTQQIHMNRPVEELMSGFAERSGLDEAENFARIFRIAKRSGGQLVPIIRHTVQVMEDRFQVKEEIRTLTASRKLEQKVMNLMPVLMVIYIDSTSQGFFDVMYTTVMGRAVMTVCLCVYLFSCWLAGRILDIPA